MGGTSFSLEKYNAREIALSSDLGRGERLLSREVQNLLAAGSADASGTPFSSLLTPLVLTAVPSSFSMSLADGDCLFYFPTDSTLTADDSALEVVRWRSVPPLVFGTPDGSNGRIDLVCAQPAMVDADLTSRNVLVDPASRTIAAQNLYKTSNPTAVVSVVAGTPSATPVPPAVPSGKVALLEVFVPAAAPDSTTFVTVPRLLRRAPFPWSVTSGIMTGFKLRWDLTAPTTSSSGLQLQSTRNKVVIDGELLEGNASISALQDSANNPFGSAAGASDKPYFLYACGGRHAPQGAFGGGAGFGLPFLLIESLTPPDLDNYGRPTAALTGPRGTIPVTAATYVGLGFVVATTTNRRACTMDDAFTTIVGSDLGGLLGLAKTGAGVEALGTPASKPSISKRMVARLSLGSASTAEVHLHPDQGDGAAAAASSIGVGSLNVCPAVRNQVAGDHALANVVFGFNPLNAKIWIGGSGLATGDVIQLTPMAYSHHVARIAGG